MTVTHRAAAERVFFVATFATEAKGAKARAAIVRTGTFRYKGRELDISKARLNRLKANFDRFERAGEIPLDYDHGTAIGQSVDERKSAGWLVALSVGPDPNRDGEWVLWGDFRLNPPAKKYVENEEYRFLSIEFDQNYFHPEAQEDVGDYLQAVALTNRPFVEKLPGMVLMSRETAAEIEGEQDKAGEGRAARGSEPPQVGARAEGDEEGLMKINLTQFGGPAEGGEEDVKTLLSANAARLTKAEADAKAAKDRADKAEADAKLLSAKAADAENQQKVLLADVAALKEDRNKREFARIFDGAKSDPQGARALESERTFLEGVYLSQVAAGKADEFEKWMLARPRVLAARPAGSPSASGKAPETSAEAKFLAACAVIQNSEKVSFTQAAQRVARENPELADAYSAEQSAKVTLNRQAGGPPSGEVV